MLRNSTHDTHSELCDAIRISKGYRKEKWGYFRRAESFYNVATQEEEYADLKHPSARYHEKSHGESYQITEMFINNRQMLLDRLLKD